MTKRNTIEVDDEEDLIDEHLVNEELEIFERESLEAASRGNTSTSTTRPEPTSKPAMISRQTQTVSLAAPPPRAVTSHLEPVSTTSISNVVQAGNAVRTLTRQLRTGTRKIQPTRTRQDFAAVDDDDDAEEEVDDFEKLETGISDPRMKRNNIRAGLNWFQLLFHDFKLWIEKQRNERYEFPLFLKRIKSIQGELGSSTAALFLFVRYLLMVNIGSAILWMGLVIVPQAIYFDYNTLGASEEHFEGLQLFLGTGRVAESWLFFKGYSESFANYKMYVAYLITHFIVIFIIFAVILTTIGQDVIREGSKVDDQAQSLSMSLFSSWDYTINSHDAIKKQEKSTLSNFKDLLCELTSAQKHRTRKEKRIILALRTVAWFIWALLVGGAITAIVFIVRKSNSGTASGFLNVYGPTIALTAINTAVPFLIQQLTLIESYDIGRTEQYVTLSRVYVMRMISLLTFIITLINNSDKAGDCPQLYWGQEFYKLIIISTISNCATLMKYPLFLYLLDKRNEVDLPSTLMSLIYFQGCIWFGNLFCPLLSVLGVLANLIYFQIGSKLIKKCCQPPTKRYNSQNSMFFNSFLAFTIFIMAVTTCYIIVSRDVPCGPYSSPKFTVMWDTWTVLEKDLPEGTVSDYFTKIFSLITSAAVAVPVVFLLSVIIWLLRINLGKMKLKNNIIASELAILRVEKQKFMKERRQEVNGF